MIKRFMSILLCVCMLASAFSAFASADGEVCQNHTQHTEDCGFAPAMEESCQHQCAEACYTYTQNCQHLNCQGCTYVPAVESYTCSHSCDVTVCGFVAPTQGTQCTCPADENGTVIHVENCGYIAPTQGSPCVFHGVNPACTCKAAQPEAYVCNHECSVNSGCLTPVRSCIHKEHDSTCGYVPASEGSPCTHSCDTCKPTTPDNADDTPDGGDDTPAPDTTTVYPGCAHHNHDENCGGLLNNCTYVCQTCVAEIQQMINALPDYVTSENKSSVEAALTAIQERYILLSNDAVLMLQSAKFDRLASMLTVPPDLFSFSIAKMSVPAVDGLLCNFTFVNTAGQPVSPITAGGAAVSSVSLVANGAGGYYYLPAGTYTIVEQVDGNWLLSTTVNGAAAPGNTFTGTAGGNYNIMLVNVYSTYSIALSSDSLNVTLTYDKSGDNMSNGNLIAGNKIEVSLSADIGYVLPETITLVRSDTNGEHTTLLADTDYTYTKTDSTASLIINNTATASGGGGELLVKAVAVLCTHPNLGDSAASCPDCGLKVLNDTMVYLSSTEETYDGTAKSVTVTVMDNNSPLSQDADYTVEFTRNDGVDDANKMIYAGNINVKVTGKGNYTGAVEKNFTIKPMPLTINVQPSTKTYGTADPTFTVDDQKNFTFIFSREHGEDVGEYEVTATVDEQNSPDAKNYDIIINPGKFTITRATPTAADFVIHPPMVYTDGFKWGDVVKVADGITGMGEITISYEPGVPDAAGTYKVKIDVAEGKNYSAASGIPADGWTFVLEADPADTANTEKVENITKDNVKPEDKTDLEKAKADLEKALEDNKDKYTDEQKKDIQADIDRIEEALKAITPVIKQYIITYGNHGYWYKGSYYALAFKCDGPNAKFLGITIDGHPVDKSYYTSFEGSTIVNLSPQLLNLLPVGAHSITFAYSDGSATGYFYVLKAPINAVMTGDDSSGGLMALSFSLSVMGFVLSLGALKRRKTH